MKHGPLGLGACLVVLAFLATTGAAEAAVLTIDSPADGATCVSPRPTIQGTADAQNPNVSLSLSGPNSASRGPYSVTTTGTGSPFDWSQTIPVADALTAGTWTATATQGGGDSGQSASFTVKTAPSVSISTPPAGRIGDSTPDITGTAGTDACDDGTVTIDIFAGATATGSPLQTLTPTVSSSDSSFTATAAALTPDGQYTVRVRQGDAAGNTGQATRTFTVDTTAPIPTLTVATNADGRTNDTTPAVSGVGGTATGDLTTITVEVYEGMTVSGSPIRTNTFTAAINGDYSGAISPALVPLTPGTTYTARAIESDDAGNTTADADAVTVTFTVDTFSPTVALNTPTGLATSTPSFTGTGGTATGDSPTVTLRIYDHTDCTNVAKLQETLTATVDPSTGNFSATSAGLTDGTYVVCASQTDDVGNPAGTAGPVAFTIVTTLPRPSLDDPDGSAATKDTTPSFSGVAGTEPGDSKDLVTVYVFLGDPTDPGDCTTFDSDATFVDTATYDPRGNGSFDSGVETAGVAALADGDYTAIACQEDTKLNVFGAGPVDINGVVSPVHFTVDTVPPGCQSSTCPSSTLGVTSLGTQDLAAQPSTNNNQPTFTGAVGDAIGDDPQVRVRVRSVPAGDLVVNELTSRTGTSFTFTPATQLPDGEYTVTVEQGDWATNSDESTPQTFVVDTVAPIPALTPFTITNNNEPDFSGVAEDPVDTATVNDTAQVFVEVFEGSDVSGAPVAGTPILATGGTTGGPFSATSPQLADGVYTARARQIDRAGNEGLSDPFTFTVDTVPPSLAVTQPAPDGILGDNTPTVTGTAEADQDVTVKLFAGTAADDAALARTLSVPANGAGEFSVDVTPELPDGVWTVQAIQSDAAGNEGASSSFSFQVDTGPPVVTLESVTAAGVLANGSPTLRGTAEPGEVTIAISPGSSVATGALRTLRTTAGNDGNFAVKVDPPLGDGTYTAQAHQTDAAGNAGESPARTFEVDATAPQIEVTGPADDAALPTAVPIVTGRAGTAARDADAVSVTLAGPVTVTLQAPRAANGAFQVAPPTGLPDGRYRIVAQQSDQAGNVGSSNPVRVTLDTIAPDTVLTSRPFPPGVGTRTVTIRFGATEAATFACEFDGKPLRPACQSPLTLTNLVAGKHTLKITATDLAGNEDPTPEVLDFTVDVAAPNMRLGKKIGVDRRGRLSIGLKCPNNQSLGPCVGTARLLSGGKSVLKKNLPFEIPLGTSKRLHGQLSAAALKRLKRTGKLAVQLRLTARDGRDNIGSKRFRRTLTLPKQ